MLHAYGSPWRVVLLLLALYSDTAAAEATTTARTTAAPIRSTTVSTSTLGDASQVVPYRYAVVHGNISANKPTKLTTVCNFLSPNASLHDNCAEDKTAHLTFIDAENFTVERRRDQTVILMHPPLGLVGV